MKQCVLEDKICTHCGECEKCDLDPNKVCDNCGKCIDALNQTLILMGLRLIR